MRVVLLLCLLFSAGSLHAEEKAPKFLVKARMLPLLGALSTSILALRLDHAFVLDTEMTLGEQFSVGISVGHGRMSSRYHLDEPSDTLLIDYREEWIFGLTGTYYFSPLSSGGSWLVRPHVYYIVADNALATNVPGTGRVYTNIAHSSSGSRGGLEVGYTGRSGIIWWEATGGIEAYFKNPYRHYSGKNDFGVPGWATNLFFGIGDIYPTANFSFGVGF